VARILIVEDEKGIRATLAVLVGLAGHEIEGAGTVDDAQQRAQRFRPQLLLLDWRLPDGTGGEVAEHVRASDPGVAIVFMSGEPKDEIQAATTQLRPSAVLQKPVRIETLLNAIEEAVAA